MTTKPKKTTGTSFAAPVIAERGSQFIREWRLQREMTVKELGAKAGLTGSMIAQLERGNAGYTKRSLEAIAGALGVPAWQLLAYPPADAGEDSLGFVREAAELWEGIPDELRPLARKVINGQAENIRSMIKLMLIARDMRPDKTAVA